MATLVLWFLGSLLPFIASAALLVAYLRRWREIRNDPYIPIGEPAKIPAYSNVRRETTRLLGNSLFILTAVWVLYSQWSGVHIEGLSVTLLIIGQWLIGSNSITDWIDNQRLERAVAQWDREYVPVRKDMVDSLQECIDLIEASKIAKEKLDS